MEDGRWTEEDKGIWASLRAHNYCSLKSGTHNENGRYSCLTSSKSVTFITSPLELSQLNDSMPKSRYKQNQCQFKLTTDTSLFWPWKIEILMICDSFSLSHSLSLPLSLLLTQRKQSAPDPSWIIGSFWFNCFVMHGASEHESYLGEMQMTQKLGVRKGGGLSEGRHQ